MRVWLLGLWNRIPPGVAIAVLTIPAFILPFVWEDLCPLWKGVGIAGIVLLVALEISVVYRERGRQDQAFMAQMERFEQLRKLHDAYLEALNKVRAAVNKDGLRSRALSLSESLLEFIYKRLESAPHFSTLDLLHGQRNREWADRKRNSQTHHISTNLEYFERFRDRVVSICGEMRDVGVSDSSLESALLEADPDGATILFIAQRIGDLADQLRD